MAYPKRLNASNVENQNKAIQAHAAFVNFVNSKVNKFGIAEVLSQGKRDEFYWLREAYERVLNFAEEVQIKRIPTQLEGTGDNGEFKVTVEIADENNASPESRNRISEYVQV